MSIIIKNAREIDAMRAVCKIASNALKELDSFIKEGITTKQIDDFIKDFSVRNGVICATVNYGENEEMGIPPFPAHCCTSVNSVACHGIPSNKEVLKDGDIINVDVTFILNGFHGDTSKMYLIGNVSEDKQKLIEATKKAMYDGISVVRPGARIRDIGKAIEKSIAQTPFNVSKEYVGHGIGYGFHEEPQIPHFNYPGPTQRLRAGMTFTIEPILNMGSDETITKRDGWTVITTDGLPSAQFEHTVLVTDGGFEVLT